MNYFVIAFQVIVGISILNVWLLQKNKATWWRGGSVPAILEEFEEYGLSKTLCYITGFLKVTLAILLIVAKWHPILKRPAAVGLATCLVSAKSELLKV